MNEIIWGKLAQEKWELLSQQCLDQVHQIMTLSNSFLDKGRNNKSNGRGESWGLYYKAVLGKIIFNDETLTKDMKRYDLGSRIIRYGTKSVNLENVSFKSQDRDFKNLA